MADIVMARDASKRILADMKTALTGLLIAVEVHLFQSDSPVNADFDPTDPSVIEADYNTYAAQTVTFLAVSRSDDGNWEDVGTVPEFRPTDALQPNDIYGGWIINGAGDLIGAFRLDTDNAGLPLPMNTTVDSILLTLRVRVSGSGLVVVVS